MPAIPRLRARQEAFAIRTVSSEVQSIRATASRGGPFADRIRDLAHFQGIGVEHRPGGRLERISTPGGLFSPGVIAIPSVARTAQQKQERNRAALEEARKWEEDPNTLWTDGSALPSGVCAVAVVGYLDQQATQSIELDRYTIPRRTVSSRPRIGRGRGRNRRTYGEATRSVRILDGHGGFRLESWSLGSQASPFDAEVSTLVRAIEICALDAEEGLQFGVFTDSQAAMQRLQDDMPGPGQALARRGIRVARQGIIGRGASIRVEWVPGHCGVQGNELADSGARDEAIRAERLRQTREERGDVVRQKQGMISISFIKTQARRRANKEWGRMVAKLNKARGYVTSH